MKLRNSILLIATGAFWLLTVFGGIAYMMDYGNTPGVSAAAPGDWPVESGIARSNERMTLVMLAHPRCACTRASLSELSRLMTQVQGKIQAYVIFIRPKGFPVDWEKTDLWSSAAAIPNVSVMLDDEGAEAGRFHAATSGQSLLYSKEGKLLFSGGITGARAQEGDNAGKSALVSLINEENAKNGTPVFGCPLFAPTTAN